MCDSNFYETDVICFLSGAQKGLNSFKFVRCYVLKKNFIGYIYYKTIHQYILHTHKYLLIRIKENRALRMGLGLQWSICFSNLKMMKS